MTHERKGWLASVTPRYWPTALWPAARRGSGGRDEGRGVRSQKADYSSAQTGEELQIGTLLRTILVYTGNNGSEGPPRQLGSRVLQTTAGRCGDWDHPSKAVRRPVGVIPKVSVPWPLTAMISDRKRTD